MGKASFFSRINHNYTQGMSRPAASIPRSELELASDLRSFAERLSRWPNQDRSSLLMLCMIDAAMCGFANGVPMDQERLRQALDRFQAAQAQKSGTPLPAPETPSVGDTCGLRAGPCTGCVDRFRQCKYFRPGGC